MTAPGIASTKVVVGIGLSSSATACDVADAVDAALRSAGLMRSSIARVATRDELVTDARVVALGMPITGFSAAQLDAVAVPNPSTRTARAVGTASVAEAAAILGAGSSAELVVVKQRSGSVTVAVAQNIGRAFGSDANVSMASPTTDGTSSSAADLPEVH